MGDEHGVLGVYKGYGEPAIGAVEAHEALLGRPVGIGNDYLPHNAWSDFTGTTATTYQLGPWRAWRDRRPGSLFAYGVPLLVDGCAGQFARGVAGEFDAYYDALARRLVGSGHPDAVVRLGWEPNNTAIGPWQACDDPEGYAELFRHVVTVFRAVPGQAFTFELSSSLGLIAGHRLGAFADYYPGDAYVDHLGMNAYDIKYGDPAVTPEARFDWIRGQTMGLDALAEFAREHGRRIVCSEWGLYAPGDAYAGGGDNPYFVERMAGWFAEVNVFYQSYFDSDWGGGTLADFPRGRARYAELFGSPGR